MRLIRVNIILLTALLAGCSEDNQQQVAASSAEVKLPVFETEQLKQGQVIWEANCKVCHATGLAGAPKITDKQAWSPRIAQGKTVLYGHAMNGFMGPAGTEMPARGGNDALTDNQVKAAVDYMVAASQ